MFRKLKPIDFLFIIAAIISLALGIKTILQTQTIILPGWLLALIYGAILLILSFGFGFLFSSVLKIRIQSITVSSIIIATVCLIYYFKEFSPTYKIIVPEKYSGDVKLFRSTLTDNQLSLNKFGVGYITDKTYRNGFKPVIYQNGQEITKDCKNIGQGVVAFAGVDGYTLGPYVYFGFTIPGNSVDTIWRDLKKVLELKVIDTSIIMK